MRALDLMTRDVVQLRPDAPLDRAVRAMRDRECGCAVVVDAERRPVGIVTDRDVCLAALEHDRPLSLLEVRDAMTSGVHACAARDTVHEVERRMGQRQVRRLPVVDAVGRLVGIVSLDDLAREACREDELLAPPVSAEAVGLTLGQIARPRFLAAGRQNGPFLSARAKVS